MENNELEKNISRRDFLKVSGVAAGALAMATGKVDVSSLLEMEDLSDETYKESSQSWIAETHEDATRVARILRGVPYASPSNVCGPLAFAVAMGWKLNPDGTISYGVDSSADSSRSGGIIPSEMFLGSPERTPERYLAPFPSEQYDEYHITESIGILDFDNLRGIQKLEPGDFLYLDGGSFTHYITISRRDNEGRLYCVSNIPTEEDGERFHIKEVMLWDPKEKDGYFRDWSRGVGKEKAYTGRRGFYLWRRRVPTEHMADDPATEKYRDIFLNKMVSQKEGEWNVYINEFGKGGLFEWRDMKDYHSASTIKVPISILAMQEITKKYSEEIEEKGLEGVLEYRGYNGRTFDQLLDAMLVKSEESATESLSDFVKEGMSLREGFRSLGMNDTVYEPRRITQKDLFVCWRNLFAGRNLERKSKEYIIKKLGKYTESDDGLLGVIRKRFPDAMVWNKRGTIAEGLVTVQDSGIIHIPSEKGDRFFYMGIAGESTERQSTTYEDMEKYIEEMVDILGEYVIETELKEKEDIRDEK